MPNLHFVSVKMNTKPHLSVVIVIVLLEWMHSPVYCYNCACAVSSSDIRQEATISAAVVARLPTYQCLSSNGTRFSDNGSDWVSVIYNRKVAWINGIDVTFSDCPAGSQSAITVQLPGCQRIVSRDEWGARVPMNYSGHLPAIPKYMFIHHGDSKPCFTKEVCIDRVQAYQNWHMDGNGWDDIGYSFLVGEDGYVYEGRGWDTIGAHTYGYNSRGLAICVIGDFTDRVPNHLALDAIQNLISCGAANNKLLPDYILRGHRDVYNTACPGHAFYELVKKWPHY